jgi:hypothetical protein
MAHLPLSVSLSWRWQPTAGVIGISTLRGRPGSWSGCSRQQRALAVGMSVQILQAGGKMTATGTTRPTSRVDETPSHRRCRMAVLVQRGIPDGEGSSGFRGPECGPLLSYCFQGAVVERSYCPVEQATCLPAAVAIFRMVPIAAPEFLSVILVWRCHPICSLTHTQSAGTRIKLPRQTAAALICSLFLSLEPLPSPNQHLI